MKMHNAFDMQFKQLRAQKMQNTAQPKTSFDFFSPLQFAHWSAKAYLNKMELMINWWFNCVRHFDDATCPNDLFAWMSSQVEPMFAVYWSMTFKVLRGRGVQCALHHRATSDLEFCRQALFEEWENIETKPNQVKPNENRIFSENRQNVVHNVNVMSTLTNQPEIRHTFRRRSEKSGVHSRLRCTHAQLY